MRVALGARRWAVIRMVVGQGARLVAIGLAAGLLCSLALTRTVAALLYQSDPYDFVAFALIPAVLVPSRSSRARCPRGAPRASSRLLR